MRLRRAGPSRSAACKDCDAMHACTQVLFGAGFLIYMHRDQVRSRLGVMRDESAAANGYRAPALDAMDLEEPLAPPSTGLGEEAR